MTPFARELVERFGSPIFVYDAAVLRERIAAVRTAFGSRVRIAFALKANPCVALAAIARVEGLGAEVASAGEILVASAAGFTGDRVLLAGPGKSDDDLQHALSIGARVHLESEAEHERIVALAGRLGARPIVAIRVQSGRAAHGAGLRMADGSSRFGVDRARVVPLARRIIAAGCCELVGLCAHAGSQISSSTAWLESASDLVTLAAKVEAVVGRSLPGLDFGGGFAWPVHAGIEPFDFDAAGLGLQELLERAGYLDRDIWIEPGRALVAPAGAYLTRVVDVKDSGGRRHVVIDGGMHHLGAAAGFGAPMRRAWRIAHGDEPDASRPVEPVTIGGPLCTPADRFGADLRLPRIEIGDVIVVRDAGAYGLTYSPTGFLSRPTPAEILIDGDRTTVVRAAGSHTDVLRNQSW